MSIQLGNTEHTGWYLLSGVPPDTKITGATQGNKPIPSKYATTFDRMIVDNLKLTANGTKTINLTFGSTIYYFDHTKIDKTGANANDDGSGWNPSLNFMQNNWNIVPIANLSWGNASLAVTNIDTSPIYNYTQNTQSNGYSNIFLDARFGYWVYIVSNPS